MTVEDALACRRALREIREIAAVAVLDGGQMSNLEALQTIAAIAGWVADETGSAPRDCGDVIRRLDALIGQTDVEVMDDHATLALFRDVNAVLEGRARPLNATVAS